MAFRIKPILKIQRLCYRKNFLLFNVFLVFSSIPSHAQTISYNDSIQLVAQNISQRIGRGDIVAIVDFQASTEQFSNTVINDLTSKLLANKVRVVERRMIDHIMREQNFQYSGYVSDESMVSLGKMLGSSAIVIGNGENLADYYRINFRMLSVETGEILLLLSVDVRYNSTILRLLEQRNNAVEIGNTRFSVGLRLGPGFEINTADEDMVGTGFTPNEKSNIAFAAALCGAFKINHAWSIQPELIVMLNNGIEISGQGYIVNIQYPTLDIPLLVRWNFIQAPVLASILLGPYLSLPIGKLNLTVDNKGSALDMNGHSFGITGGFSFGYRLGTGHILMDLRYLNDFSSLFVRNDFGEGIQNAKILIRRSINMTFGYEFSL